MIINYGRITNEYKGDSTARKDSRRFELAMLDTASINLADLGPAGRERRSLGVTRSSEPKYPNFSRAPFSGQNDTSSSLE